MTTLCYSDGQLLDGPRPALESARCRHVDSRSRDEGKSTELTGKTLIFSSFRAGLARRALALAFPLLLVSAAGCRTSSEDVNRWASTVQGPKKLVAVLTHDKYPMDLRVEAAAALVRM